MLISLQITLCRHDKIKSYSFIFTAGALMMLVIVADNPRIPLTLFPAAFHSLVVVADQVHAAACMKSKDSATQM